MATIVCDAAEIHRVVQERCEQDIRHGRIAQAEALIDLADSLGWTELASHLQLLAAKGEKGKTCNGQ